uniref:Uncharacterized protein n=2 Tax=Hemiselmis andersenii TaxID=464988 RepID=A0A6U4ZYC1_HEMAN|mmetsp:Transcript_32612/g.76154  ORF Transcript_32612/g.76154 Transcript_32612/m.76154 type:complete len:218 (-) Transcript_32612:101-754(-)|eukprot:CAMPEP_0114141200 /NCGR_PEP_ID=MMETSP0043_2-20121206/17784_1 /TAXON_ID=464988 /ORGANISM="Hemiselmis andersenii, Strain CCMP644" /LENGTH=217 /DNA_ID=CAMNT_0001235331 /DNA_START=19 /DNA_END=672 /DNA_ORIENTATION=+
MATPVKIAAFFVVATVAVPTFIFWSPGIALLAQFLEGCWLAAGTWALIHSSDARLQALEASLGLSLGLTRPPTAHAGGPLEFVVSVPALPMVWAEQALRGRDVHKRMRYVALNVAAYACAPLWFLIVTAMHLLVLGAVTAISLGVLLPWTGPVLLTVCGYLLLVPIWVASTYICSFLPILAASAILPEYDPDGAKAQQFLVAIGFSMPFQLEDAKAE